MASRKTFTEADSVSNKKKDWWAEAKTWVVEEQGFEPCASSKAGKGSYGSVYPARSQRSGLVVAVKFCRSLDEQAQDQENATLRLLKQNPHPNIACVMTNRSWADPCWVSAQISELAFSDLHYWLVRHVVDCPAAAHFAKDVAAGVTHLHSLDVEHRDLKPSNMMLYITSLGQIQLRIGDFGSARPPPGLWTGSSRRSRSPSVEPHLRREFLVHFCPETVKKIKMNDAY
jgi:serine/threonine protein kinase